MKILILGNGYLGNRAKETWGDEATLIKDRITSVEQVKALIAEHQPDALFNAAGVTGKPNVDWCEDHPIENMKGNTILPLMLAEACNTTDTYMLHLATGCIFYGPSEHEDGVWNEDDFANPVATYSRAKYAADLVLSTFPNIGLARLRMPIDSFPCSQNLIDKIAHYPNVIDVENSATIVPDLLDACYQLMEKKGTGIFHCTNPGTIKHREILALYKELVDPEHSCNWITEEELVTTGLATKMRSNNFMRSTRLEELGISMPPIQERMREVMVEYAKAKK